MAAIEDPFRTQQVTGPDLRDGRIRIPSTNTSSTKKLFPSARAQVKLLLRGHLTECSWDPRMGPDRQRSGVLRVGPILRQLVREHEVLTASPGEHGIVVLE